MNAFIFAAGLGTRMQPLTLNTPKALIPVNGIPLLEIAIRRLKWFGYTHFVVNVHYMANQIIDFLAQNHNFGTHISISNESDLLLDTGGGLVKAVPLLSGNMPILACNVDILCNLDLNHFRQFHLSHRQKPLVTLAIQTRNSSRQLLFNRNRQLCGWQNTQTHQVRMARPCKDPNPYAFSGIQLIDPKIFQLCTLSGVFSVIDLYLQIAKKYPIIGYLHNESKWLDVGKPEMIPLAATLLSEVLPDV